MWQDIRYALRMLTRTPVTTGAAVVTLAIGIGASLAIFTAVDRLLLRPLPYPDPEQLIFLERGPIRLGTKPDSMIAESFKNLPVIAAAGAWSTGGVNLDGGGESLRLAAAVVDDGFFPTMGVAPIVGQPLPRPDGSRFVVLSHDLWQARFAADSDIAGQAISLNGQSYIVTGVMPRGFAFPGRTDVWVPPLVDLRITGSAFAPEAIARLAPGVSLEKARAVIAAYDQEERARYDGPAEDAMGVSPLGGELTRRVRPTLLLLAVSAALLLIAACASVANLLLARVSMRAQELAVRAALGATRWRLTRQLLIESLLLSSSGAIAGGLLAVWGLQVLGALSPASLDDARVAAIDLRFLAAALAAALVTALSFGAAPGLAAAATQSGDVVRAGRQQAPAPVWRRIRSGLITAQMAVALILLTTSAAAVAALIKITRVDPGFGSTRAVSLTVTLPASRYPGTAVAPFAERVRERLAAVPGVRRVGATGFLPGSREVATGTALSVPGRPPASPYYATFLSASPQYFEAIGIRLAAGRTFTAGDRAGAPPVVILSESAARGLFPDGAAIGQRIQLSRGSKLTHEVVGVVEDVHLRSISSVRRAMVQAYVPLDTHPPNGQVSFIVEVDGSPAGAAPALRSALSEIDPALPVYNVEAVREVVKRYIGPQRMAGTLISSFAIVTLMVAAIGLYGLMSQLVSERTREIAIRLALGAAPARVRGSLLRYGVLHALAGAALGWLSSSAALAIFGAVLPGLEAPGALIAAANAGILFAAALAAVWIPASRILRLDPIVSLRQ